MIVTACLAAMLSMRTASGQDYIPDVPEHHSIYRTEAKLRWRNWLRPIRPEDRFGSGPPHRRIFIAQEAIETIAFLTNALKSDSTFPGADERETLRLLLIPGLRQWVSEFRVEIERKGVRSEALIKQLNTCASILQPPPLTPPFSDVPQGHWAAGDIQELKDLGILKGYPNGRFGGSR